MNPTWEPIRELPDNMLIRSIPDLENLSSIWIEQAEQLRESDSFIKFNEQINREWAIETGIIEHLYTIDRGVTQILIQFGIEASLIPHGTTNKPVEEIVPLIKDQEEALEFVFDFVKQNRVLNAFYIKQLHEILTRHQESTIAQDTLGRRIEVCLIKGDWKRHPNNPKRPNGTMHFYCPPEQVQSEMERLVSLYQDYIEKAVSPIIVAAWLHHRFTQIHPFQDGNGRVARCLTSMIFIKERWFPLVINRDIRNEYIQSCEHADLGDLNPMVLLFSKLQKKAFIMALSLSQNVLQEENKIQNIVDAAITRIKHKIEISKQEREQVFSTSSNLEEYTFKKLNSIAANLKEKLESLDTTYSVYVDRNSFENRSGFKTQIVQIANQLNYFADTKTFASWVRLTINEERQAEIVFCFDSLGIEFIGVVVAVAFLGFRERDPGEGHTIGYDGPYPISEELFQFSYKDNSSQVLNRYISWLERSMVNGLEMWKQQI